MEVNVKNIKESRSEMSVNVKKKDEKKGSRIKEILFTDRGGTNTKEILGKIPEKYIEFAGFLICAFFMIFLIYEQVMRAFFDKSVMESMFYLGSVFAEIFAVIYILRFFFVEEKSKFSTFIKEHIWDILLFLMLPIAGISALRSEVGKKAFAGVMIRHDGFYSYLTYAAVYICSKAVKSEKLKRWILRIMGITISFLSINTVLQYNINILLKLGKIGIRISKYSLYSSIYFNINHFGYVLTIGVMALMVLVVIEEKKMLKILWFILAGYNVWSLIINNTFGAYIAVCLGIIFMSVVMIISDKKRYKSIIAVLILFIGVSIVTDMDTKIVSSNFGFMYSDSKNISNDNGGSGRIGLWKQTIKFIKEKPLLGWGPEGLYDRVINGEIEGDVPHNEYLQHMLYMGIPAGLFYIAALISLFITMVKKLKYLSKELLGMGAIVFAYCVSAFFGLTLYNTVPYYFIFLGGISICGTIKKTEAKDKESPAS